MGAEVPGNGDGGPLVDDAPCVYTRAWGHVNRLAVTTVDGQSGQVVLGGSPVPVLKMTWPLAR